MLFVINFIILYFIVFVLDSFNIVDIFLGTFFFLLFEIEVSLCIGNNINCNSVCFNYNLNIIL